MKYKNVIFDLDGTLLDTLEDLKNAVNFALEKNGFPVRSIDEVRSFVGNGIKVLIRRAVPEGTGETAYKRVYDDFVVYYKEHCKDNTAPYRGIPELLDALCGSGVKMAIVSNKGQFAVDELYDRFFRAYICTAVGGREDMRTKPCPDGVFIAMDALSAGTDDTVYIGDSDVDIETAKNAGLDCISAGWGFRSRDFLIEHGAAIIADKPGDVMKYI
jgi:phosphoglycolate phosphatase